MSGKVLENARLIKPFPVKATASFYYVQNEIEIIPSTLEAYKQYLLPFAYQSDEWDPGFADDLIDALLNEPEAFYDMFEL